MANKIDAKFTSKLESLISSHGAFGAMTNNTGQISTAEGRAACRGWLTSAENVVSQICPETSPYFKAVKKLSDDDQIGLMIYSNVLKASAILKELRADIDAGLLSNLGDTIRAEAFVEFLDHGRYYLEEKRKMESGVIIGVVFEDSIRRLCEKKAIPQKGRQIEDLISDLQRAGSLNPIGAKKARVAAHVRTKATHAQWDEFELEHVNDALAMAENLIEQLCS